MREITISKREEGQRLFRFLEKYLPGASSGFLHKMLRKKNIKINDGRAQGKEILCQGDRIQIYFSEETLQKFTASPNVREERKGDSPLKEQKLRGKPAGRGVKVLYQDDDVILFHKPAGILTQRDDRGEESMNDLLIDYCLSQSIISREDLEIFRPSVANRLDRNTSGILLAGISVAGLQALSRLLREKRTEKYYICPVEGRMEGKGTLTGYLIKDRKRNRVRLSDRPREGGSPVETRYEVLDSKDQASLLRVQLLTGKSHQIRAHMASLGHPVLGDPKYGSRDLNRTIKKELGIDCQLLHSYEIRFPVWDDTGDLPYGDMGDPERRVQKNLSGLCITDPIPSKMAEVLRHYGLDSGRQSSKRGVLK